MFQKIFTAFSNAEWEVMRVIWTLGQATSRQLIEIMEVKHRKNKLGIPKQDKFIYIVGNLNGEILLEYSDP